MVEDARLTYGASGVDVDIESMASRIMYEASRTTWENRRDKLGDVVALFDDFSGFRGIDVSGLPPGTMANLDFDGTGTKIEFAERSGHFDTIGIDLICMVAEDAARRGVQPVIAGTVLDVNTLGEDESRLPIIHQIGEGLVKGAALADIAIVNGEIAQLSERVTGQVESFGCIWNAGLLWFGLRERAIDGKALRPGDILVGLHEPGLRANGISLVRKTLKWAYGNEWEAGELAGRVLIDWALMPSTIYTPAVVDMTGGYDPERSPRAEIHAIAHISGGGLPEKLDRMLRPTGLGAVIHDGFPPSPLMHHCQHLSQELGDGKISDRGAYRAWCMGIGMVIATPDPDSVNAVASEYGFESREIGRVVDLEGMQIRNHGYFASEEPWLDYA